MSDALSWLSPLYEILDTDYEEPPERHTEAEVRALPAQMTPVEILAWVLVHEMDTEGLEVLEPLVDRRGGERLYHAAVALTSAPPYERAPGYEGMSIQAPKGHEHSTFLTSLRDYGSKGETSRVWFFEGGLLYSATARGKITTEIDDPATFVHALRAMLL